MGLARTRQAEAVEGAVTEIIEMNCDSGASVGDLVRLNYDVDNFVDVAVDNSIKRPIIGMIKEKLTSTTCKVILTGVVDKILDRGRVYLADSGAFTTSPPTAGYLQTLGYSFGNGKLRLDPNAIVTKIIS